MTQPATATPISRKTISTFTAAEYLGVSPMTVLRWIEDGTLVATRPRDRGWWRVSYDSVADLATKLNRPVK